MKRPPPFACRALLFDLDGTLVDSSPDLWRATNHVLAWRGYPLVEHEKVRHLVGNGARALLARGFLGEEAEAPAPGEDADFDASVVRFLEFYGEHLTDHSRPYPGVVESLERLRARGFKLAVVTNKMEHLTQKMLKNFQLTPLFDAVVGGDTLPVRKPDPAPLLHALQQMGSGVGEALMVGDSETDVAAARNAGCPVVAVSFGYSRGHDATELGADRVVDRFTALEEMLVPAG